MIQFEPPVPGGVDPATLPLSHAAACRDPRLAPGGKPLAVATLWRLINRGKVRSDGRRVYLETVITGRGRYATPGTIAKFFADLNAPSTPPEAAALLSHGQAEQHLDQIGVK